jgi:hypothetical protein
VIKHTVNKKVLTLGRDVLCSNEGLNLNVVAVSRNGYFRRPDSLNSLLKLGIKGCVLNLNCSNVLVALKGRFIVSSVFCYLSINIHYNIFARKNQHFSGFG